MAGGTWVTQNKTRPGAYVNTFSKGGANTTETTRGVVALPFPLDFGPEGQVIELTQTSDLTFLGYDLGNAKLLLLREAFKRAATVLLYRLGTGDKATKVEGSVTITALYGGTRGNAINVVSKASVDLVGSYEVETFLDGRSVDVQTVKTVEDLTSNRLVSFGGTGALSAFTTVLEGGTDSTVTIQDYSDAFEKIQLFDFNTLALPVSDQAIKTAGKAFAKRLRDEEGKKCQVVIAGYDSDGEVALNVKNGVVLTDGTVITPEQATVWVAAASAAAGTAQSLTYTAYDDAVDVSPRLTNADTIEALKKGEFVFTEKRGKAVVEQDINSLHTFTSDKNKLFSKNRVLRALDDVANYAKKLFEDNYIGKVNNDVDGLEMFKSDMITYFDSLQGVGAITNFEADDIEVLPGADKDAVLLNVALQPVDAMEKLYMTVEVV